MASTDFVKFNAYSIKDLINRKLAQDTNFTDQIYEGSNLAVLVDIFSYMAHSLLYCLNNAASESMFSDTQVYENMNRLCQFIGYNPRGMAPATANFVPYPNGDTENFETYLKTHGSILKYSYINTGKTDSNGKPIYYSVGDEDIKDDSYNTYNDYEFKMVNGIWKVYSTVFQATGSEWETFTLQGLGSNSESNDFVAHGYINVFAVVYAPDGKIKKFYKFKPTSQQLFKIPMLDEAAQDAYTKQRNILFTGNLTTGEIDDSIPTKTTDDTKFYNKQSHVFNIRLNETKEYQITFGDGTSGAKLPEGASIYVVYLDTNGPEAEISPGEIRQQLTPNRFSVGTELLNAILLGTSSSETSLLDQYYGGFVTNITANTRAETEETVSEIRENAPNWFKMGNRLVTHGDYEYYLKNHPFFRGQYLDVKCMNNWEYISSFYNWLYRLGLKTHNDPRHYLSQNRLVRNGFVVADSADCNNIYLWVIENTETPTDNSSLKEENYRVRNILAPIKDLTHEPTILRAVPVDFRICAAPRDEVLKVLTEKNSDLTLNKFFDQSYLEVTLDDDALYSSSSVATQVASKFITFFSTSKKLGQNVDLNVLHSQILDIEGVQKIRTVFVPTTESGTPNPNAARIYNGICMASYSTGFDGLIDLGSDLDVSNSSRTLEDFQYAYVSDNDSIFKHIKVIKKSLTSLNKIQY